MWVEKFNNEHLIQWLSRRQKRIPSGDKDPYASSMRSCSRFISALKGSAESRESQQITDLVSAQLYSKESGGPSLLAKSFLEKCSLFDVPDSDELSLILILLLEALLLHNEKYLGIVRFWYMIAKRIPIGDLTENVGVSYLISYLSVADSEDAEAPLFEVISDTSFKDIKSINLSDLKGLQISNEGGKIGAVKLVETIDGYATRSARKEMFKALNLIYSFDKSSVINTLCPIEEDAEKNKRLRNIIGLYYNNFSFSSLLYDDKFASKANYGNFDFKGMPSQKILFGAPGTGKSFTINEDSKRFAEQGNVTADEQQNLKLAVENAQTQIGSRYILLNAIGHKYSNLLKNLTKSQIRFQFGKNGDLMYIGANAKDIVDKLQDKNEAELSEDFIKNLIKDESARNGADKLKWVNAIGYKYSSFLSDYSLSSLKETFELSESQKWWIYRGAHAALSADNEIEKKQNYVERVTFHPNYSYAQFVGTYKPVQDEDDSKDITYSYVPGPFMRTYVRAKRAEHNKTDEKFLLIIEEINRANVAAVFGDVFQLLDRKKDGESEYPIAASEDIKRYLEENGINDCNELKIPSNMYIWATMNSADQGVFPMDTAFKRRWEFEYIGVDDNQQKIENFEIPMQKNADGSHEWMKWNELRTKINDKLTDLGINEDKLLGPFFISLEKLQSVDNRNESEAENFVKAFKSKVLMYLFEDAVKMKAPSFFKCDKMRYSEICKKFDTDGIEVFNF